MGNLTGGPLIASPPLKAKLKGHDQNYSADEWWSCRWGLGSPRVRKKASVMSGE